MKNKQELNKIIRKLLKELGCPADLNGYEFLVSAILLCIEYNQKLKLPMMTIYNEVAKEFDIKNIRVERDIRYAIETSTLRANPDKFDGIFGWSCDNLSGKPTNSEYIFSVVDWIKNFEYKEMQ